MGSCLRVYMRHLFCSPLALHWGFPDGSVVRNLPAMQETEFHPQIGKIPWRRRCQPTPVFLPGESHGAWWASVHVVTKESDMTEHTHQCGLSMHQAPPQDYFLAAVFKGLLSQWSIPGRAPFTFISLCKYVDVGF